MSPSNPEKALFSAIDSNNEVLSFPLTFAQRRLWFLDRLEGSSRAYHLSQTLKLIGDLNYSALAKAINSVVERHEILRTTFHYSQGEPWQIVAKTSSIKMEIIDLQDLPESERLHIAQEKLKLHSDAPFLLDKGPLLRVALIQLTANQHLLRFTMHHIITDAWSMGILSKEIAAYYQAHLQECKVDLPELTIQYGDFADWQRESLTGDILDMQLSYWKKQLNGIPPAIDLPTDYPRPAVQTYNGASEFLKLSESLTHSLRTLSKDSNVTLFMTLLAAFSLLLHRYSGQDDIVVGSPSAGRDRPEIENLIGFFVNTLVLRTSFQNNPSFRDLLSQVREMALGAFTHQEMPFEKLVEVLQPARDLGRSPLFQVWFNMLNMAGEPLDLFDLEVKKFNRGELPSKFDLTMYVLEQKNCLKFNLVYNTDLFKSERIAFLLEQFQYLLEQIVQNPATKIQQFSLVTPTSTAHLPNPNHKLAAKVQPTIISRLSQQMSDIGDRLAIVDDINQLTYCDLDALSDRVAIALMTKGVEPQDTVAVYADRSATLVVALLGIWKAGAVFTILDSAYPAARLASCVKVAQPKAWIATTSAGKIPLVLEEALDRQAIKCRFDLPQQLTSSELMAALPENLAAKAQNNAGVAQIDITDDSLAYVAFTSGTTGIPKAVLGTHAPLAHFLQWHTSSFDLQPSDRFCMLGGLAHDPLLRDIFTPLWLGATLYIPSQATFESIGGLATWASDRQISIVHLTPAAGQLLKLASSNSKIQLTTLRYAFFGGDTLTWQDVKEFKKIAPQVTCINFYGATETPQATGFYIVPEYKNEKDLEKLPIGVGIEDSQLLVMTQGKQLAGIGEIGEIWVRSPYLAKGYLNDQTLESEKFVENPYASYAVANADAPQQDRCYRTGDLGRYTLTGNVEHVGRQDRQIKIRGFRVELGDIESAIRQSPEVVKAIVINHQTKSLEHILCAYIVPVGDAKARDLENLKQTLKQTIAQKLPSYMVPSQWIILEKLPLTPNGKLDRKALPSPERKLLAKNSQTVPQDRLEHQLIEIWQRILNQKNIDITENFFDLGGHSLMALQLFSEIEKAFGKKLPLATLFQAPTIKSMSEIIRRKDWLAPWNSLVPIQPNGSKPPLFYLHAGGGNLLFYRDLIMSLADDQPVYGLQPRGLDGSLKPSNNICEMASFYISQIETVQPEGPYHLAGLSTGGLIAWEMSRQLTQKGQSVNFLALLDTYGNEYPKLLPLLPRIGSVLKWVSFDFIRRIAKLFKTVTSEMKTKGLQNSLVMFLIKLKILEKRDFDKDETVIEEIVARQIDRKVNRYKETQPQGNRVEKLVNIALIELLRKSSRPYYANTFTNGLFTSDASQLSAEIQAIRTANFQARTTYRPQSFDGKAILFRASQRPPGIIRDPYLGWDGLAKGGIVAYEIPGTHTSIVKSPKLADILNQSLNEAQEQI